jgi:hypothetical protein
MRISKCGWSLLEAVCLMPGLEAWAQTGGSAGYTAPLVDVSLTYTPMLANVTTGNGFTMQGGSAEVYGQFWRNLGAAADITGLHTGSMNTSTVGLDLVAISFGPRYAWTHNRFDVFGQVLAGEAIGMNSTFPSAQGVNSSANSLALELGGGVNRALSKHLSLRLIELDLLRTQLPNANTNVQNNLKCSTGLVFRIRTKHE